MTGGAWRRRRNNETPNQYLRRMARTCDTCGREFATPAQKKEHVSSHHEGWRKK